MKSGSFSSYRAALSGTGADLGGERDDDLTPEETMKLFCAQRARAMWAVFTPNEKAGVRFGMFPAAAMTEATKEGYDARLLSLALMDCAKSDGGVRA